MCRRPGGINEPCHATRPCGDGLTCQPVLHVCAPEGFDLNGNQMCESLRSDTLASIARDAGATMSYGVGADAQAGGSLAMETGVVYGPGGEYGCYATVCGGVQLDASINAYMALGVFGDYEDFDGVDVVTTQGIGTPFVKIGPGFSTAQVMSLEGEYMGSSNAISFGIGVSPLPMSLGVLTCCTALMSGTGAVSNLRSGVNNCRRDLEGAADPVRRLFSDDAPRPTRVRSAATRSAASAPLMMTGVVSGNATRSTPVARALGRPIGMHGFQCEPGLRLTLRASSSYDNVLFVLDDQGRQVAYADDISATNTNARLVFECPGAGGYEVAVGPFLRNGSGGRYTLTSRSQRTGAQRGAGTTRTIRGRVPQQGERPGDVPAGIHEVSCATGQRYRFVAESTFDNALYVLDARQQVLASNDDTAPGNTNASIEFTCPRAGTYEVYVAEHRDRGVNQPYRLMITDFSASGASAPNPPTPATPGASNGASSGTRPSVIRASLSRSSPQSVYPLQCRRGAQYRLRAESSFDNVMSVHNATGTQVALNDDTSRTDRNAQIDFTCPDTGTYEIRVRSFSPRDPGGAFELNITPLHSRPAATGATRGATRAVRRTTTPMQTLTPTRPTRRRVMRGQR